MKFSTKVEEFRVRIGGFGSDPGDEFGKFFIPGPCGAELQIIASSGDKSLGVDWEHVSVSVKHRCPNWLEMCFIKDLFWGKEECVMQLHPPESQYVNTHQFCLHLWKPCEQEIPMPPMVAV